MVNIIQNHSMEQSFKMIFSVSLFLFLLGNSESSDSKISPRQDLPRTYEYFVGGNSIESGLVTSDNKFWLNGKEIRIISGGMHYFRIHPALWRDRLKKLRATGANGVETYVSWNLHEPRQDEFDFGEGDNDFSEFMDIRRFIQIAQEEDLLVIFRPGPYICAEWDYGGFPSWLQRDPNLQVRTNYQPFLDRSKIFFDKLLSLTADLQFTRGGPIIAIQLENEYASFDPVNADDRRAYLEFIKQVIDDNGWGETLKFTADNQGTDRASLPGMLLTANTHNPQAMYEALHELQPDKPFWIMESYPGWMDHWFEEHHIVNPIEYGNTFELAMGTYNASVNFYMFHGGTNFAFMAGANWKDGEPYYHSDTTSYDYDAPLSEAGDYTPKYNRIRDLIEIYSIPALHRPEMIPESEKRGYPNLPVQNYLDLEDILAQVPNSAKFRYEKPVSMEMLPMNGQNGPFSGQSYGYILYRKTASIGNGARLKAGPINDFATVMVDGKMQDTNGYWIKSDREISLEVEESGQHTIDILVENMGRVNFGWQHDFLQQKGINESILLDGEEISDLEVVALEFTNKWTSNLQDWKEIGSSRPEAPVLMQSRMEINEEPADTFLDMRNWRKGIVFVNGFNIGRYFEVGPQQTLYAPAPLWKRGTNIITIFEQLEPGSEIWLRDTPILTTQKRS